MKIQEAVELFRENTDEKNRTWGQDRPKINRFIDLVGGNTDAQDDWWVLCIYKKTKYFYSKNTLSPN
ncbi:hypothetical protein ACFX4I_00700 [Peribacillus sp. YIM B13472]|uniref:hypothetical protein n=1 Tax=Peribacillus sp. YIM B13472 TaxID=3366297 RepID=UPI0036713EC1